MVLTVDFILVAISRLVVLATQLALDDPNAYVRVYAITTMFLCGSGGVLVTFFGVLLLINARSASFHTLTPNPNSHPNHYPPGP